MSTYEIFTVIGMGLWIVVTLAILAALVHAIRLLREISEPLVRVGEAVTDLNERLQPVLHNLERASDQARRVAARLKDDVDDVSRAVRQATASTGRMVELAEERVAEVAALLSVVQEELEATFVSTASLLRGLRRGTRRVSGETGSGRAAEDPEG